MPCVQATCGLCTACLYKVLETGLLLFAKLHVHHHDQVLKIERCYTILMEKLMHFMEESDPLWVIVEKLQGIM